MEQLPLLPREVAVAEEARPLSRRSDPVTSKMAAREMVETRALAGQRAEVLAALREHPDVSSDELAVRSGLDRYACARRLPELARLGFAIRSGRRKSTETGRFALTWTAVGDAS